MVIPLQYFEFFDILNTFFQYLYKFFSGCYAQPAEETPNITYPMSTGDELKDQVKECRYKCQPITPNGDARNRVSMYPAMFFWLSKDKTECNCLPDYPLGGDI